MLFEGVVDMLVNMLESQSTAPKRQTRERTSADKALDILDMFKETRLRLSALDVAVELGVGRSTAYRYLQTLTATGFVEEDPARGFRLGARIFDLARLARRSLGISDLAIPVLRQLSDETNETALLTIRSSDRIVCLEKVDPETQQVRLTYERGSVLPLNAGASAWVLLAWERPELAEKLIRDARLESTTDRSLTSWATIAPRLAEIRETGWAIAHGELDPDALGIAAPVSDETGRVVAGISLVTIHRRGSGRETGLAQRVKQAADDLSQRLARASQ